MSDTKLSGLTALAGADAATGDLMVVVDVSDSTMAASGTTKKITLDELKLAIHAGRPGGATIYGSPDAGENLTLRGNPVAFGSVITSDRLFANVGATLTGVNSSDVLSRVWDLATDDIVQHFRAANVQTTNATVTTALTIPTVTDTVQHVEVTVTAIRTDSRSAADVASYKRMATYANIGGTVSLVGSISAPHTGEGTAGWDCTLTISGTNVLVRVTGEASKTIRWHAVSMRQYHST